MKNYRIKWMWCLLVVFGVGCLPAFAQNAGTDYLFPGKNQFQMTVATGVPYVGLVEASYGLGNRFAAGVMIGQTPHATGYGIRLRAILLQKSPDFRVYFRMPIFYYGSTKRFGDEPWMLTWPVIATEWKISSRGRFSIGGGFVEAHCIDALIKGQNHHEDPEMGFNGGYWNTIHSGLAWSLGRGFAFQSEASLVMQGLRLADENYVGGPPFILVLSLTKNFTTK